MEAATVVLIVLAVGGVITGMVIGGPLGLLIAVLSTPLALLVAIIVQEIRG